jgi:hypothetical protein
MCPHAETATFAASPSLAEPSLTLKSLTEFDLKEPA